MKHKYPYIPDRKIYAAVMFACKMIRENGHFNTAVKTASEYYGVDEETLKHHIRERQAAGQKGTIKGRKFRWFIITTYEITDAHGYCEYGDYRIIRAINSVNASSRFDESDWRETKRRDYGGAYAPEIGHKVVGEHDGYETKAEAMKALALLKEN